MGKTPSRPWLRPPPTTQRSSSNLCEAAQRIRAVSNRTRATGMREDPNQHDFAHRVASALAMTEAAGMKARRKLRRELG